MLLPILIRHRAFNQKLHDNFKKRSIHLRPISFIFIFTKTTVFFYNCAASKTSNHLFALWQLCKNCSWWGLTRHFYWQPHKSGVSVPPPQHIVSLFHSSQIQKKKPLVFIASYRNAHMPTFSALFHVSVLNESCQPLCEAHLQCSAKRTAAPGAEMCLEREVMLERRERLFRYMRLPSWRWQKNADF